jgi:hypothetical protein
MKLNELPVRVENLIGTPIEFLLPFRDETRSGTAMFYLKVGTGIAEKECNQFIISPFSAGTFLPWILPKVLEHHFWLPDRSDRDFALLFLEELYLSEYIARYDPPELIRTP